LILRETRFKTNRLPLPSLKNLLATFVGVLALGISGCQPETPKESEQALGVKSTDFDAAPPSVQPTVAIGEMFAELVNGRLSLKGNQVPRISVLRHLANLVDFQLVLHAEPQGSFTGHLQGVTIEQALSYVLTGIPYAVHYDLSMQGQSHKLVEVLVDLPLGNADQAEQEGIGGTDESAVGRITEMETSYIDQRLSAEWLAANPETSWKLADSNTDLRLKAVRDVEAEGSGITVLKQILAVDTDPDVRALALIQLGESDSFLARQAVLDALQDLDSKVVITALEVIEVWIDKELIPHYLEPMLLHPEQLVRDRVVEAIESLE